MTPVRRHTVPTPKWHRLRDHLPPEAVAVGDAVAVGVSVDGYRSSRSHNALALEGALAQLGRLLAGDLAELGRAGAAGADLGDMSATEAGALGRLFSDALDGVFADSARELAQGLTPGDRGAVRRLGASAAGELAASLRRLAVRAETLELGLTLRAEDLEADQRIDDHFALKRRRTDAPL